MVLDERVELVAYDDQWPTMFDQAAEELLHALAPWVLDIEHIGSTAVPGLAAKPVIDIQVGVRSLDDTSNIVVAVTSLGYEYVPELEGEVPNRRYFRRWSGGRRTHQIHLVERNDLDWWERHVRFRDWLRTHPGDRAAYEALKLGLAAEHAYDRETYTDKKSDFVRAIEAKAATDHPDRS